MGKILLAFCIKRRWLFPLVIFFNTARVRTIASFVPATLADSSLFREISVSWPGIRHELWNRTLSS